MEELKFYIQSQVKPKLVFLVGNNEALFSIHQDGTIEFGPAFTTQDEASKTFWDAIQRYLKVNNETL